MSSEDMKAYMPSHRQCDKAEFSKGNVQKKLSKMTDDELASWQNEYQNDSAQYILAQHEWNRRLTSEQVKATRFAARMTLWATLLGILLGAMLTILIQKYFK